MTYRVFYAAGPGNIIAAHKSWAQGVQFSGQVSKTYSGQVADFCKSIAAESYFVSYYPQRDSYLDGSFLIEHLPKQGSDSSGIAFYFYEFLYVLRLVVAAKKFKANIAIIHSATAPLFMSVLFRLAGLRIVSELHNTLWPVGFSPKRFKQRFVLLLDALFFNWCVQSVVAVSPACIRQIAQLAPRLKDHFLFFAQYNKHVFAAIPAPAPVGSGPLRIYFAGRIVRNKGVFDLVKAAELLERSAPGKVFWEICGDGPDLEAMKGMVTGSLSNAIEFRGRLNSTQIVEVIRRSHMAIVPTRSDFNEGMAMSVIEPILACRPVITSSVVPALEIFKPCCIEAVTDCAESYADRISQLLISPDKIDALAQNCRTINHPFYDLNQGLCMTLHRALGLPERAAGL